METPARTALVGCALVALLAGCAGSSPGASSEDEVPTTSPSTTPVAASTPGPGPAPTCEDGTVPQGSLVWLRPDGTTRWRTEQPWRQVGSAAPVEDGTSAWAVTGTQLRRFDAATGSERWAVPLPAVAEALLLVQGTLVVSTGDRLLGLDPEDGQERWRADSPDAAVGPVATDSGAVVWADRTRTRALDAQTGVELWSSRARSTRTELPTLPGLVVREDRGRLLGLDASDGSTRWSGARLGPQDRLDVSTGQVLVIGDARVRALSPADGDLEWERPLTGAQQVVAGRAGVLLRSDDRLELLDRAGRPELDVAITAERTSSGEPYATVLDDGVLVLERLPVLGTALVRRSTSGEAQWTAPTDGRLRRVITVDSSALVVDAGDALTGLDPRTGEQIWDALLDGTAEATTRSPRGLLVQAVRRHDC